MDQLHTRLNALEQQMHTVNRRLRWWRGLACGLVGLAVLSWALPVVTADDAKKDLEQRVAALEKLLKHFRRDGNEVFIKGANLNIVNGLGQTDCTDEQGNPIEGCPNGLGNLIVGYNERRPDENVRIGSHNVVVGRRNNFESFGGLVVGNENQISGEFASVSGGAFNVARGDHSAISGGVGHETTGEFSAISGGGNHEARGARSWVGGGIGNIASGVGASVSGGRGNLASGVGAAVSGGNLNEAIADDASVSGGTNVSEGTETGWSAGSFGGEVSGSFRSP